MVAAEDHERPERLLVAARLDDAEGARYLLVRWPDWPYPALLSLAAPGAHDSLEDAVTTLLLARLRVRCQGPPRQSAVRVPVRLAHPRFGGQGLGWLRAVAVSVVGEPEPDALLEDVQALSLPEALEALPTDIERTVLREAASLFPDESTVPDDDRVLSKSPILGDTTVPNESTVPCENTVPDETSAPGATTGPDETTG